MRNFASEAASLVVETTPTMLVLLRLSPPHCLQLFLCQLSVVGSSAALLPEGVERVLKSKACRSAVMFGDELGSRACTELVRYKGRESCVRWKGKGCCEGTCRQER